MCVCGGGRWQLPRGTEPKNRFNLGLNYRKGLGALKRRIGQHTQETFGQGTLAFTPPPLKHVSRQSVRASFKQHPHTPQHCSNVLRSRQCLYNIQSRHGEVVLTKIVEVMKRKRQCAISSWNPGSVCAPMKFISPRKMVTFG